MALQSSGAISLLDVQNEFGGASPIGMNEYYGSGNVPVSGTISLSDFYGETAFSANWSGNSLDTLSIYTFGIETSGNLARYRFYGYVCPWFTANLDGTFTGNSAIKYNNNYTTGIYTSGNLMRIREDNIYATTWVAFTLGSGFSGSSPVVISYSYGGYSSSIVTSGGLLRYERSTGQIGAWISLT